MLRAIAISVMLAAGLLVAPSDDPGGQVGAACGPGGCYVGATDPGAPAEQGPVDSPADSGHDSGRTHVSGSGTEGKNNAVDHSSDGGHSNNAPPPDPHWRTSGLPCQVVEASPPPAVGSAVWEGHTASEGRIVQRMCNPGGGQQQIAAGGPYFEGNGTPPPQQPVAPGNPAAPPPPPPINPQVLAQQAMAQLQIPAPDIRFGPDPDRIAVNFWTSLWVANATPPPPKTITAGQVSVTATVKLTSVSWAPGEVDPANGQGVGSMECASAGTAPTAGADPQVQPACGYKYHWRSLPSRTSGSGTWQLQASATWTMTWTATGTAPSQPTQGTATTARRAVSAIRVGEWRTAGGYGG